VVLAVSAIAGCGDDRTTPTVRDVPGDYRTIQSAVDEAEPGDLVRIAPGVYRESVVVAPEKERIVIRGLDRNRTIVDGGHDLLDGITVNADGVAVENLTVRGFLANGVLFTPGSGRRGEVLTGWRGSYITAYANGLYGVYTLGARAGRFDHVYASGHPDSGVYIGECSPCDAVVTDSIAEHNMVGFEATNASGNISVVRSTWRENRVGVALNSQRKERLAPQRSMAIVGNLIADNDDAGAPRGSRAFGLGIVLAGGQENTVARNRVVGHEGAGIALQVSVDGFQPEGNRVVGNVLRGNALDLAVDIDAPDLAPLRSCFAENRYRRSLPPAIERRLPCDRAPAPVAGTPMRHLPSPPQVDYRRVAAPPPQPQMPDARSAPPRPALGLPGAIDLDAIPVP
jgi:Right handed beta helix region